MEKSIHNKLKRYLKLENEIVEYLQSLPKSNMDCECDEKTYFEVVEYISDNDPVIGRYCLECGGTCIIGD